MIALRSGKGSRVAERTRKQAEAGQGIELIRRRPRGGIVERPVELRGAQAQDLIRRGVVALQALRAARVMPGLAIDNLVEPVR